MRAPSIRNIRRGVAVGAAGLLLLVVGFFAVARLRGRLFHLDLPGRLGVDISQTANGFTYSQSQKGHTLFTIHASKLVQYKADQAQLHDVTITLYGPEGSARTDKIYGSDFLYDRKAGVVRATGAVQIDFAAPAPRSGPGPAIVAAASARPASSIHVTTSGVTFNQASGEASTDQRVDFALTRATGSATGANFNSKTGVLILDRDVALTTSAAPGAGGADVLVHAAHAQLLREAHQAYLIQADTTYNGARTTSDQATVNFRPDGSAEHIDARGHVHLTTDDGAVVHTSSAVIELDPQSQPVAAEMGGGVTYNSATPGERMQGSAVSGTLNFVSAPARGSRPQAGMHPGDASKQAQALHHAQFRDAVTFVIQRSSYAGNANGSSTREMRGSKLDVDFAPGADGKAEAQHALAVGGAAIKLHDIPAKGPAKTTTIAGDQLLATLAGGRELRTLDGKGKTSIVDNAPDGTTSTSTGDTLHVTFLPVQPAGGGTASAEGAAAGAAGIDHAVQTGGVAMTQLPAPGARNSDGSPQAPMHATAARAEYGGADEVLHLTGDPHLRNDTVALSADFVDYHRDSGDALARGNVKSTYVQQPAAAEGAKGAAAPTLGGDGPVHIIADHAQLMRASDRSLFFGSAAQPARMWQGGDAVAAPVLELSRTGQTLDAHGVGGERGGAVVHSTLGARPPKPGTLPLAGGSKAPGDGSPARLTSLSLHYSDQDRRADLHGSVVAEQPSGVIHADEAQVFLTPSVPGQPSTVDHMVATSHVVITQPGRRGTGDRLVYTAADGRYVLTGSPAQPPRVADAEKGTTTGAALIFKGADDSVEVSDHVGGAAGSLTGRAVRTVTDTHSPK